MLESLEGVTFDDMISIKEGISIIGDEESFLANLKYYADAFVNEVKIVHNEWLKQEVTGCYKTAHAFKGNTSYACCMPLLKALAGYNINCKNGNLAEANKDYRQVLIEIRKTALVLKQKYGSPQELEYFDQICRKNLAQSLRPI